jgi:soluble lytic murein transglycosylase-like protein
LILKQMFIRIALVAALGFAVAAPASAQIYSWRDANGHLVLSNRPQGAASRSYTVPRAASTRATRFVAAERSRLYDGLLTEHARLNGVRSDLVRAVVQVESGFNPAARSPKGALGLMQLMPATIAQFGVRNPLDPAENVRAGVAYLRQLLDRYQDNEELALAAYNAGPGAVEKHGQRVPPYRETQDYVTRVGEITERPIEVIEKGIYKTLEIVDGRPVPRYSDRKPASGSFEVVPPR